MKKYFKIKIIAPLVAAVMLSTSCGDSFLDINDNPNAPASASLDLLLTGAEVASAFWTSRTMMENSSIYAGHWYELGASTYNVSPGDTSNDFDGIYTSALKEYAAIEVQSDEQELQGYRGIARVMKAYLFSILVDNFGDVPYTEALQGENILFPKYDDDAAIYASLLQLIDDAKADLVAADTEGEIVTGDLVYGGDLASWIKAANTIKLRLYINMRLVDASGSTAGISALIAEDDFIDDNDDNFQFFFGSTAAPLNRHPVYHQDYVAGNKAFYQSNYFMYKLWSKNDPRLPYYIFRQGDFDDMEFDTTPCSNLPAGTCVFWELLCDGCNADVNAPTNTAATGYIGRDPGDASGIPGDNTIRATFGVYPVGGSYDDGSGGDRSSTSATRSGGLGAGVIPWMTSSMRAFMLAESALMLGTAGDARALFEEGIRESMADVSAVSVGITGSNAVAMVAADIDAYVANQLVEYDAAVAITNEAALDVVITEKHAACFGNGFESYNDLRRTGYPGDLPDALVPTGPFPSRFQLPVTAEGGLNPNAPDPAALISEPVFWDI